ncbi:MAG TPA: DsbA family protein [Phenylobacterium sp.]|nr:DsbA family protein [Phenylobacterium sp.]
MKTHLRAVLALSALIALSGCQKVNDAFGQQVRGYLLAHPEVLEEALQKLQEKKQAEAAKAALVGLSTYRRELERDPRDFVANPNGKITVVEFFDYRCGYCKLAAPEVVKLVQENPDIRFVFKEFPIFGGPSNAAAKVALSPQGKAKGMELFNAFMADKTLDDAAIDRHLVAAGIDPAAARAAGDGAEVQKHIADTRELAAKLAIEGTPAFIVGDRLVPGADLPALRAAIDEARRGPLKHPG